MKRNTGHLWTTHFEQVPLADIGLKADVLSFPRECPRCLQLSGFPFRVRTGATRAQDVNVELRCRQCRNEWEVERRPPA